MCTPSVRTVAPAWRLVVSAGLSVLLHLSLGWEWTVLAGLAGGLLGPQRGWMWGGSGVALGWALLIAGSYMHAPDSLGVLVDFFDHAGGNIPGIMVVGVPLLFGALLGFLGGAIGQTLHRMYWESDASSP